MSDADPAPALEKRSFDDDTDASVPDSPAADARGTARVWSKMDLYVLPVVTILYFLSSLVRRLLTSNTHPSSHSLNVILPSHRIDLISAMPALQAFSRSYICRITRCVHPYPCS